MMFGTMSLSLLT